MIGLGSDNKKYVHFNRLTPDQQCNGWLETLVVEECEHQVQDSHICWNRSYPLARDTLTHWNMDLVDTNNNCLSLCLKDKNTEHWKAMRIGLNAVTNGLDRISAGSWVESTQLTKSWLDFSIRRLPLPAPFPLLSHGDPGISLIKDETLGYPTARPWNASRMCTLLTLLSMNCSKHTCDVFKQIRSIFISGSL